MTLPDEQTLAAMDAEPPPVEPPPPIHEPPQLDLFPPGGVPPQPADESAWTLSCPGCSGPFQALASMAGMQVACPHCGAGVTIPQSVHSPPADLPFSRLAPAPRPADATGLAPVSRPADGLAPAASLSELLPPGAYEPPATPAAKPAESAAAKPRRPKPVESSAPAVTDLLPRGAASAATDTLAERPVPAPQLADPETPAPQPAPSAPKPAPKPTAGIPLPTSDGDVVTVRDEPRIVRDGDEEVEIRRLSPEEKARRRLRKNIVLFVLCLTILLVVLYIFAR